MKSTHSQKLIATNPHLNLENILEKLDEHLEDSTFSDPIKNSLVLLVNALESIGYLEASLNATNRITPGNALLAALSYQTIGNCLERHPESFLTQFPQLTPHLSVEVVGQASRRPWFDRLTLAHRLNLYDLQKELALSLNEPAQREILLKDAATLKQVIVGHVLTHLKLPATFNTQLMALSTNNLPEDALELKSIMESKNPRDTETTLLRNCFNIFHMLRSHFFVSADVLTSSTQKLAASLLALQILGNNLKALRDYNIAFRHTDLIISNRNIIAHAINLSQFISNPINIWRRFLSPLFSTFETELYAMMPRIVGTVTDTKRHNSEPTHSNSSDSKDTKISSSQTRAGFLESPAKNDATQATTLRSLASEKSPLEKEYTKNEQKSNAKNKRLESQNRLLEKLKENNITRYDFNLDAFKKGRRGKLLLSDYNLVEILALCIHQLKLELFIEVIDNMHLYTLTNANKIINQPLKLEFYSEYENPASLEFLFPQDNKLNLVYHVKNRSEFNVLAYAFKIFRGRPYPRELNHYLISQCITTQERISFLAKLLEFGANPDTENLYNFGTFQPILSGAAALRNFTQTKMLLDYGANTNALDGDGSSSLHAASQEGTLEIVNALLNYGASPLRSSRIHNAALIHQKEIPNAGHFKGTNIACIVLDKYIDDDRTSALLKLFINSEIQKKGIDEGLKIMQCRAKATPHEIGGKSHSITLLKASRLTQKIKTEILLFYISSLQTQKDTEKFQVFKLSLSSSIEIIDDFCVNKTTLELDRLFETKLPLRLGELSIPARTYFRTKHPSSNNNSAEIGLIEFSHTCASEELSKYLINVQLENKNKPKRQALTSIIHTHIPEQANRDVTAIVLDYLFLSTLLDVSPHKISPVLNLYIPWKTASNFERYIPASIISSYLFTPPNTTTVDRPRTPFVSEMTINRVKDAETGETKSIIKFQKCYE